MSKPHVWVVEMRGLFGRYTPCAEAQLTRADARRSIEQYWSANNPDDQFRVAKYVRVGPRPVESETPTK